MFKFFLFIVLLAAQSFGVICDGYGDFVQNNGHYYTVTKNRVKFSDAKTLAENSNGYIAIPDSAAENDFLKTLIPGGEFAWIGLYDPNYSDSYCYTTAGCSTEPGRFRTVKGAAASFSNWMSGQPDNLVYEYDVYNGTQMVLPLGEHWAAMTFTGLWQDDGNHASDNNNPIKHVALFEFDTKPECYNDPSTVTDTIEGKKCQTAIYNSSTGVLSDGQAYDCQADQYGHEYCPAALAACGEQWDYENGYSVAVGATTTDYTAKISTTTREVVYEWRNIGTAILFTRALDQSNWCYAADNVTVKVNHNLGYTDSNGVKACGKPALFEGKYETREIESYRDWHTNWFTVQAYMPKIVQTGGAILFTQALDTANWCFQPSGKVNINHNLGYTDSNGVKACGCNSTTPIAQAFGTESYRDWHTNWFTCYEYETAEISTIACPIGYVETTGAETANGECKKTVNYTYYNYLCSNDPTIYATNYTAQNTGGNCVKTDPSKTTDNTATLDDPCNSSTPPVNNCKRQSFTCVAAPDRPCSYINNSWQCSPFPCFGGSDMETTDAPVGINDANNDGWDSSGSCIGQLYIFPGKDYRCRSDDAFFGLAGGGCCDKEKVFAGLVQCKENEKKLAKLNKNDQCHYIGEYCSKNLKLGFAKICIQHSKSHCCFNGVLARIINEQGRIQLGRGWGSAEAPNCKGFTPDEFQKLDFSEIDMSEFFDDLQTQMSTEIMGNTGTYIQNKVSNILNQ